MMNKMVLMLVGWLVSAMVVAGEKGAPGLYAFYNGDPRGGLVDERWRSVIQDFRLATDGAIGDWFAASKGD